MKKFNFLPYLFISLATYAILTWWMNGKTAEDTILSSGAIGLKTTQEEIVLGSDIRVELQNNTDEAFVLKSRCPEALLTVERWESEGYKEVQNTVTDRDCSRVTDLSLPPHEKVSLSLLDYSYSLFNEPGKYRISLTNGEAKYSTPEFDIVEPGLLKSLWRTLIYIPLLNLMIAILVYTPGHSLALGIFILTLLIRTLLLAPSQKAMKAQKRMQALQPKLEELKKKYANDQARLSQETMLLWKTHKVSPLSSCLPLLIQFPILIALYYSISGGLSPDEQTLLYPFLSDFSLKNVNPMFLGFNLFNRDLIVFPILTGALQFLQIQLMNANSAGKKAAQQLPNEIQAANNMMKYMMPIMIAIFTSQLPAAVGLYWAVSTCYGIVQQIVVNKGGSEKQSPDEEVEVRVLHRK